MTDLKLDRHTAPSRGKVVEVHHPVLGLIGVIYPTEDGVRIVSKHLDPGRTVAAIDPVEPPALEIFLIGRRP